MPDLSLVFTVRPPTVAAAVYGVMTLVSEHTTSLARLDDLRVALDELFYALPQDEAVRVHLDVSVDAERSFVQFRADTDDVEVHPSIAALVDEMHVESDADGLLASLSVVHD